MHTRKKFSHGILLLLCLTLHSNCGTEIGNPLGFLSGGENQESPTSGLVNTEGLNLGSENTDCTTLASYSTFTNSSFNYTLPVPIDWLTDAEDLANLMFNSDLPDNNSSLHIVAETLQSPIADLLTYISSLEPAEGWFSSTNSKGLLFVINNTASLNGEGAQLFELYATQGLTLLYINITANAANNGSTLTSCMVNHLEFL